MAPPILLPKITPPQRPPGTLSRRRLLDQVHQDLDRRLFLIVAPAGYGKTTLLADFAADAPFPVCWYSLDGQDRDPKLFLTHLVAAIRRRFPDFGRRSAALLAGVQDAQRELPTLVATLVNELYADVPELFALVLDDFHELDGSPAISRVMDELLRYLPDNCRLLLASRTVPRITFTSLAARMQVAGMGVNELRFNSEEVQALLRDRHKLVLLPEQAERLAEESEGWITGILLTTHTLWRGLLDTLARARGDSGRFLYAYLAEEVLADQPADLADFLSASSVLARMSPARLAELLGPGDWQAMLERAESEGLFVERLQGAEPWFRYHHLFRQFLQEQLAGRDRERFVRLHTRAAELAIERDELSAALEHLGQAEQVERAADLLEAHLDSLERAGTWRLLADLVESLPAGVRAARPRLLLARGRAALWLGERELAEELGAEAAGLARDDTERARALILRGNARRGGGRLAQAAADLEEAARLAERAAAATLLAEAELELGVCHGMRGDLDTSAAHLERAIPLYAATGDDRSLAMARFSLGVTNARRGLLDRAEEQERAALAVYEQLGDVFWSSEARNNLGLLHFFRGEFDRATETLERGLADARQVGYLRVQAVILDSLAGVQRARGDPDAAAGSSEEGLELARRLGERWLLSTLLDGLANAWRLRGDPDRAETLAAEAERHAEETDSLFDRGVVKLTQGAIALGRGNAREALSRFRGARILLARGGAKRDLARARMRLAQAHWALDEQAEARREMKGLAQALRQGGQYGLVAPEAAEQPAVLEASAQDGPPELRRLLSLVPQAARPRPVVAAGAVRRVERPELPRVRAFGFGRPRVEVDGRVVSTGEWESGRALELLFFLLASGGEATGEQITAALWPESSGPRGQSNLWSSAYRLRRAIHPEAIVNKRGVYAIGPALPLWDDVAEFERLVAPAAGGTAAQRLADAQAAANLYRGPYLETVYSEWCDERRRALEAAYLLILSELTQRLSEQGDHRRALEYAQHILAVDSLHEDANGWVVELHGRLGDRAGGMRHYQRYAELLRDELGETPGSRVEAAYRALLRSNRALA